MIYLMCSFERTVYSFIFLDSSMVEHSAVNRVVVGSSPTRGADEKFSDEGLRTFFNKTNVP